MQKLSLEVVKMTFKKFSQAFRGRYERLIYPHLASNKAI
jgi:hypothetical protein